MFIGKGRNAAQRPRDGDLELLGLIGQLLERFAAFFETPPKFTNLAFGLENATGLVGTTSSYDMRSAKKIAGHRSNGKRRVLTSGGSASIIARDPSRADRSTDGVGVRSVDANDGGQRGQTCTIRLKTCRFRLKTRSFRL